MQHDKQCPAYLHSLYGVPMTAPATIGCTCRTAEQAAVLFLGEHESPELTPTLVEKVIHIADVNTLNEMVRRAQALLDKANAIRIGRGFEPWRAS